VFAGEVVEMALEDMGKSGEAGQPIRNIGFYIQKKSFPQTLTF